MAAGCYGARRLSDLLQEHEEEEEPFLEAPRHCSAVDACARRLRQLGCAVGKRRSVGVTVTDGGGTLLCCGYRTARKALRWGDLAGCFTCGARQRFRRLPRAGDIGGRCDVVSELDGGGALDDCGRQLSPVSVLELHSDEESPVLISNWDEEDDDDGKPSSSPPSDHDDLNGTTTACSNIFVTNGKIRAMQVEVEDNSNRLLQRKSSECSLAIVSDWERIAADMSRIPSLVALDLSGSAREWRRRLVGEEEAWRVGQSIEAMIFEEVRWEAVRDMLLCSALPCPRQSILTELISCCKLENQLGTHNFLLSRE